MSLSFYSNSREDSIATFVIALILTSRFFDLNPDATLIPFAIATGAVALALSKIFYTISRLVFGYFDHRNVYTGTKSYVNAYSSSYFNQYRQSLMANLRFTIASGIAIMPPGPLWIFMNWTADWGFWKIPFFLKWYGSPIEWLIFAFFILLLIITIFQSKNGIKRLKIVRTLNALEEWNTDLFKDIQQNDWQKVFNLMDQAKKETLFRLNQFIGEINDIEVNIPQVTDRFFRAFIIENRLPSAQFAKNTSIDRFFLKRRINADRIIEQPFIPINHVNFVKIQSAFVEIQEIQSLIENWFNNIDINKLLNSIPEIIDILERNIVTTFRTKPNWGKYEQNRDYIKFKNEYPNTDGIFAKLLFTYTFDSWKEISNGKYLEKIPKILNESNSPKIIQLMNDYESIGSKIKEYQKKYQNDMVSYINQFKNNISLIQTHLKSLY